MSEAAFVQNSFGIVQDFLATAIVVDDQAFLGESEYTETVQLLKSPGRQAAEKIASAPEQSSEAPKVVSLSVEAPTQHPIPESRASSDHKLDGKKLVDKFGEFGIVCSVIRPEKSEIEKLDKMLRNFSSVADVFIFDWVLYGDATGAKTKELIRQLVNGEQKEGSGRARLILVYTGELNLEQVAIDISKDLDSLKLQVSQEGFNVLLPGLGTRIAVFGKHGPKRPPEAAKRVLNPDELPQTVIREFSEISRGLLSNAAMASITAVRRNAYQLLRRFSSDLDPAFATQSILICPEEASEQIVPIIAAEIQSVLEDAGVGALLNAKSLKHWLAYRIAQNISKAPAGSSVSQEQYKSGFECLLDFGVSKDQLAKLQNDHGAFFQGCNIREKKKVSKDLTSLLAGSDVEKQGDRNLAMLMSNRHFYENAKPILTLGTIISSTRRNNTEEINEYWICLQPICDGVRLKDKRFFPLLPLVPSSDTGESVIVVRDGHEPKFLQAKYNPFYLKMVEFAPVSRERVVAQNSEGTWGFISTDGTKYKWLSELKPSHAQRIAHGVSVAVSRIGLVESEWGRLVKPIL